MSKITEIKIAQVEARKARLAETATLLTTLIGEAEMVGKNAGNRAPTDAEVLQVLRKFEKGMLENLKIYTDRKMADRVIFTQKELDIVRLYLPAKLTDEQVKTTISDTMSKMLLRFEPKSLGSLTKELKVIYGDQFDGQQVSRVFKEMIDGA